MTMDQVTKTIEEMSEEIKHAHTEWLNKNYDGETDDNVCDYLAKHLYNAGYRKVEQGEWVWVEYGETDIEQYWKCSICGSHSYYETNYCEHCGAYMKGE